MRNLKKVLSMVLVVAMIASMLIVGAAAATEETTNYPEAADVISGIGVMEGDERGMRYGDTVTREEAAAIICRVLLGDTAETLKTSSAPFADVAASRWSAGYIAYLKNQGIVSGVSDTEFDPTAKVTGIAFAKMLLTAVGYGANDEFEGAGWDINTITEANNNGVFTSTKAADLAAAATREECMLYAFNTLTKVPVVKYNSTFESYYTGKSALDPVQGDVIPTETGVNDPYYYTLAWSNYELKQTTTGASSDDFGRPAASWTAAGTAVADAVANVEPDAVLYGSVYSLNLYNTFGKTVIKNLNSQIAEDGTNPAITIYVDGELQDGPLGIVWNDTYTDYHYEYGFAWTDIVTGEYTNQLSQTGATVELYLDQNTTTGDYSLTVVVYYEHLGKVSSVKTTAGITTVTISDIAGGTVKVTSEEMDVAGYAKKDMVMYTVGYANSTEGVVATLAAATPVVGTYTNYNNTMAAYTIDGAFYYVNAAGDASDLDTYGNTYELYLDSFGNILYVNLYEEGETANQYVYVVDAESQEYLTGALTGQDAKVAVTVLYPTGGKEVVYYNVKNTKISGSTVYYITVNNVDYAIGDNLLYAIAEDNTIAETGTAIDTVLTSWMRYTTNDAGNITLKALSPNYAKKATVTVATGKATTGTDYTANSATTLTLVDTDGNSVTYTGIRNFVDKTGTALVTYGLNSKVAKTITYVVDSISSSLNLAYCAGNWQSDDSGDTYMFYVDGVMQFITTDSSCSTGYVYNLTSDDGEYTATPVAAYTTDGEAIEGTVNAGYAYSNYGAADQTNYGVLSMTTFTYSYYEWATIDTIDETYFTTVAVEDAEDSVAGFVVEANTYYYDANTVVYDCTGMGATEISEGDVFVAYVDEDASTTYLGEQYVSHIWIVG